MSRRKNHAARSRKSYKLTRQRMIHAMTGSHKKSRSNGGEM